MGMNVQMSGPRPSAIESLRLIAARNIAYARRNIVEAGDSMGITSAEAVRVVLTILSVGVAAYSMAFSLWNKESLDGWIWNLMAAEIGLAQTVALPFWLIGTLLSGFTVYQWILERVSYPATRYHRPNAWKWWAAVIPATVVGLTMAMALYLVIYDAVWSIDPVGPRVLRLWPGLLGES